MNVLRDTNLDCESETVSNLLTNLWQIVHKVVDATGCSGSEPITTPTITLTITIVKTSLQNIVTFDCCPIQLNSWMMIVRTFDWRCVGETKIVEAYIGKERSGRSDKESKGNPGNDNGPEGGRKLNDWLFTRIVAYSFGIIIFSIISSSALWWLPNR